MFIPSVLIVDDEHSVAGSFARQFRASGWDVAVVHVAGDVLAAAERLQPDLIVLDVQLADASGVGVLQELKRNAKTRGIAVTLISGDPTPELHRAGVEAGAIAVLNKPMTAGSLEALRMMVDAQAPAPRVLFSDDDPELLRCLERAARRSGLEPISERDASNLVARAKETAPNVIVLDVTQQKMDGRDVLAALKANPETRNIRVVMLSGVEDQFVRHTCLRLGADDYELKPLDPLFFSRLSRRIREEAS